jgi:hypothetical protein
MISVLMIARAMNPGARLRFCVPQHFGIIDEFGGLRRKPGIYAQLAGKSASGDLLRIGTALATLDAAKTLLPCLAGDPLSTAGTDHDGVAAAGELASALRRWTRGVTYGLHKNSPSLDDEEDFELCGPAPQKPGRRFWWWCCRA